MKASTAREINQAKQKGLEKAAAVRVAPCTQASPAPPARMLVAASQPLAHCRLPGHGLRVANRCRCASSNRLARPLPLWSRRRSPRSGGISTRSLSGQSVPPARQKRLVSRLAAVHLHFVGIGPDALPGRASLRPPAHSHVPRSTLQTGGSCRTSHHQSLRRTQTTSRVRTASGGSTRPPGKGTLSFAGKRYQRSLAPDLPPSAQHQILSLHGVDCRYVRPRPLTHWVAPCPARTPGQARGAQERAFREDGEDQEGATRYANEIQAPA